MNRDNIDKSLKDNKLNEISENRENLSQNIGLKDIKQNKEGM